MAAHLLPMVAAHVLPTPAVKRASCILQSKAEFSTELSPVQRAQRAATFSSRIAPVIGSYLRLYSSFALREKILGQCLTEEECEVEWDSVHVRGATTAAQVIQDLKGFYVKVGQIIATRQDLFPRQYTEALAGLTDYLDPMPAAVVRSVIEQARGWRRPHERG